MEIHYDENLVGRIFNLEGRLGPLQRKRNKPDDLCSWPDSANNRQELYFFMQKTEKI